jgi:hypothetical protein
MTKTKAKKIIKKTARYMIGAKETSKAKGFRAIPPF